MSDQTPQETPKPQPPTPPLPPLGGKRQRVRFGRPPAMSAEELAREAQTVIVRAQVSSGGAAATPAPAPPRSPLSHAA